MYVRGQEENFKIIRVTHAQQREDNFLSRFPLGKIPLLELPDGEIVVESQVILSFLEESHRCTVGETSLIPDSPRVRMRMNLMIKIHDQYLSSPSCTQVGFTHTQGCMYVPPPACVSVEAGSEAESVKSMAKTGRVMGLEERALKLKDLDLQLSVLDEIASRGEGPYLCGEQLSLADLTLFPTFCYINFLLPRVFDWPDPFYRSPFLGRWFRFLSSLGPQSETESEGKSSPSPFLRVREELETELGKGQKKRDCDMIRAALSRQKHESGQTEQTLKWVYP
uniref:GST C-terminal domain-containing protein n=1 Tax=Chromera velia CCMP2878 TaxID=1169474 RepID=A0A0G4I7Z5_9ALVE|eukprot:Cvel_11789.t1-p1 / transcript=Cvel_11789.t1 / gene=Cvel_11789 / organism=Chromera_velia_CCMP2878 / gene_product=hypothetical protein / transcript_product=hypothetical protein / location=Cvel_scaffold750:8781-10862(-) / protein_length=279 / sequence_SO=supercontig / SO=protein_coding / is_pseudo=false